MTDAFSPVRVFIGSSMEGLRIARTLQAELEAATGCAVTRWDTSAFAPGSITLDALIDQANVVDFAILVATGEDTVTSRGTQTAAIRDNIILEFGLFLGALGRRRVYLLSVGDAKLPTDLQGLTRLIYRHRLDNDIRGGLTDAVLRIEEAMANLGPRGAHSLPDFTVGRPIARATTGEAPHGPRNRTQNEGAELKLIGESAASRPTPGFLQSNHAEQTMKALDGEISWLCSNAVEQGWTVTKNNPTTLRLSSPKGRVFTLSKKRPTSTRAELRRFVSELRANGLRVNRALQGSVEDSPFG